MKRKAIFSLMLLACLVTGILGMNQIKNKDVVADEVQVKPCETSSDNATINRLIAKFQVQISQSVKTL